MSLQDSASTFVRPVLAAVRCLRGFLAPLLWRLEVLRALPKVLASGSQPLPIPETQRLCSPTGADIAPLRRELSWLLWRLGGRAPNCAV